MGLLTKNTESEIVRGLRKQLPDVQKSLYESYFGLMMTICMRYSNNWDDSMEVVNTGFLKVFTNIDKYEGKGSFEGWMKKIMVNTALDSLKSRKIQAHDIELINDFEAKNYIENDAVSNMSEDELISLIQELPQISQTVFNLYVVEGYKHKEIAGMLKISEGTSYWHLLNARNLLKKKLSKSEIKVVGVND